jgi:hypothetical protein
MPQTRISVRDAGKLCGQIRSGFHKKPKKSAVFESLRALQTFFRLVPLGLLIDL